LSNRRNEEAFVEPSPPVFKKKRTIGGYEYDASVPIADRKSKGPFHFKKVEPSIFAEEVNLGAEIKRTGSAQPNLTRQHFMNTLLQNGKLLKKSDLLEKFWHIPDADLNRLSPYVQWQPYRGDPGHKRRETFGNRNWRFFATKMFEACGECRILRREPVDDIISWLDLDDFKGPAKRVLIYGEPGVGKTMAVNQIAHHGLKNEMLVIHVPILWRIITKTHATEPLVVRKETDKRTTAFKTIQRIKTWESRYDPLYAQSHRPELKNVYTYDQPEPAGIWLDLFKTQNAAILSKYKTTRDFQLSVRDVLSAGSSLLDALNEINSRTVVKCDGIQFLLDEIKTLAPEMARNGNPVLVVMDEANYLTQGCYVQVYQDPEKIREYPDQRMLKHWSSRVKYEETVTDSRRLNLMNYFRSLVADEWSGGMVIGATTTNQVAYGRRHNWKLGRHNDRSRIESDDLHTLLGDHGFQDVWHPFIPVQIHDLTNNELDVFAQYLFSKNIIYGRTESEMAQMLLRQLSGNNIERYLQAVFEQA